MRSTLMSYDQKKMLGEPLCAALVRQNDDAVKSISFETACAQANRIFGYADWGYEIVGEPVSGAGVIGNSPRLESPITSQALKYEHWTKETIDKRQAELVGVLVKEWRLDTLE